MRVLSPQKLIMQNLDIATLRDNVFSKIDHQYEMPEIEKALDNYVDLALSKLVSIDQLKAFKEEGHSLESLIQMLDKKEVMRQQKRHWFIFEDGRNVCEFCKCLYNFGNAESICSPA